MAAATSGAASISPVPEIASSSRGVSSWTIDRPKQSFSNRSSRRSICSSDDGIAAAASWITMRRPRPCARSNRRCRIVGSQLPCGRRAGRVDERVGHAAHRGGDDDDLVSLVSCGGDERRGLRNALGGPDRGPAEFHDDEHGIEEGSPVTLSLLSSSGASSPGEHRAYQTGPGRWDVRQKAWTARMMF